jgi:hypothetical protein
MKALMITFLITSLAINGLIAQDFVFSISTDLNSDNKDETIKLEKTGIRFGYKLTINNQEGLGTFELEETDGFKVIDIDTQDKYKEIAVHSSGPGDDMSDNVYFIYWYNGKEVFLIDQLHGSAIFNGNGIIYLDKWEGFWTSRDKYVLGNNSRNISFVRPFGYYVGVKAKAKTSFTIYQEQALKNKVAVLNVGSDIEILLCDKDEYRYTNDDGSIEYTGVTESSRYKYLVKSQSGLLGWISNKDILESVEGLPWAD